MKSDDTGYKIIHARLFTFAEKEFKKIEINTINIKNKEIPMSLCYHYFTFKNTMRATEVGVILRFDNNNFMSLKDFKKPSSAILLRFNIQTSKPVWSMEVGEKGELDHKCLIYKKTK